MIVWGVIFSALSHWSPIIYLFIKINNTDLKKKFIGKWMSVLSNNSK